MNRITFKKGVAQGLSKFVQTNFYNVCIVFGPFLDFEEINLFLKGSTV